MLDQGSIIRRGEGMTGLWKISVREDQKHEQEHREHEYGTIWGEW